MLSRLPQASLSRAFGRVADLPLPRPLRRPVLGGFSRLVGADPDEAELPLGEYASLGRFFVRRLRPGLRPWPTRPDIAGCPVDGVAGAVGVVQEGRALQAKGRYYSVAEFLDDREEAARFAGGTYATLYLSPRHYHRIHSPCGGAIPQARHLPGSLLPVNAPAVASIPDLFARNERLACYVDGPFGRIAVVAVGAYNVGRISAAFDPRWHGPARDTPWVTNVPRARAATHRYGDGIAVAAGDEIMAFHLGSTVVVLFEHGRAVLDPEIRPGRSVLLGQPLARAG